MPMARDPKSVKYLRDFTAKVHESEAVVSLLKSADRMLVTYRMGAHDADALLAVLSTGAEKLLKLTYGFIIEDRDGAWPNTKAMRGRTGYGHDVSRLDHDCRALLRHRLELATSVGYVRGLLDALDADPYVDQLLAILSQYGMQGRFAHLDHLADAAQDAEPPRSQWERYDSLVSRAAPALPYATAVSDEDFARLVRAPTNERHRVVVNRWREAYFRALIHGVAGEEAKKFGWEFNPTR